MHWTSPVSPKCGPRRLPRSPSPKMTELDLLEDMHVTMGHTIKEGMSLDEFVETQTELLKKGAGGCSGPYRPEDRRRSPSNARQAGPPGAHLQHQPVRVAGGRQAVAHRADDRQEPIPALPVRAEQCPPPAARPLARHPAVGQRSLGARGSRPTAGTGAAGCTKSRAWRPTASDGRSARGRPSGSTRVRICVLARRCPCRRASTWSG